MCEREGWDVLEVITDSVGASRRSKGTRSGWLRATQRLEEGDVDVFVTWEASRAQRDMAAYAELRDLCERTGTLWSYSGRVYDLTEGTDRFATGIDALIAEREAEDTRTRVLRAVRANAAAGRPHGRRLFGFMRVYDKTTGQLLNQEPHPDEAAVVRRIFADYLSGLGIRTIARNLNAEGFTTGTGAHWSDTQIKRVLVNPAYNGKRVHRGEIVRDATWDPIVTDDTFNRAQARIDLTGRRSRKGATPKARLLTGVARCGLCGGRMHVGHDRKDRKVYQCRAFFHIVRDEASLDEYITDLLLTRLDGLDLAEANTRDPEAERAQRDIVDLRARLDEASSMFARGEITGATLATIEGGVQAAISEAEARLRRVVIPLDFTVPTNGVGEWWDKLEPSIRREVVSAVIAVVRIGPTKRGSRTFDPTAIDVEWRV